MAFRMITIVATRSALRHAGRRPRFAMFSDLTSVRQIPGMPLTGVRYAATLSSTPTTGGDKSILDHLLKTETEATDYYAELAAKAKDKGFKVIFEMLSSEERQHVQWLKDLAAGMYGDRAAIAAKYPVSTLGDIKREIDALKESRSHLSTLCADQLELYRAAREMEAQSRDFYAMCATVATDPDLKRLLMILADEEEKHCAVLDGLVQFLSEPDTQTDGMLLWDDALNLWINMNGPLAKMGNA